ncbi:choline O-acetyltransferase-like protein [Labeo rohita]|uniref:Choline O-acetyltransferase n=1 Tax=Labeo rohita TaxID=84645 RepID=A0A498LK77_LABRO|nr:choline O-acetyltransferase-like protein [Labeo rohita]
MGGVTDTRTLTATERQLTRRWRDRRVTDRHRSNSLHRTEFAVLNQTQELMMPVLKRETAEAHSDCNMLPKLPVPDLQHTLDAYLRSVKHLVSETQFRKTKALVETFGKHGGVGERLQKLLLEKREKTENWVYDFWLEDMYLRNRMALPVNSSPALVFPKQPFRDVKDSLVFAARLILSVSQYKSAVDGKTLLVDVARGQKADTPLCMDQYKRLFSSYRRAGLQQDTLITADGTSDTGHVIVACKNQFFALNLLEGSCKLNEADVQAQLEWIHEQTLNAEQNQPAVGLLTADGRTDWARARDELLKGPKQHCMDTVGIARKTD